MNSKRERQLTLSTAAIAFVAVAIGLLDAYNSIAASANWDRHALEFVAFAVVSLGLLYGSLVYQLARERYLTRRSQHKPPTLNELEGVYTYPAKPLAILIPSYKEEERVLRQTVLSAALVEYPERRIVVLLDDPPHGDAADLAGLEASRRVVREAHELFAAPARRLQRELWNFLIRKQSKPIDQAAEAARVRALYEELACWLEVLEVQLIGEASPAFAHADELFLEKVVRALGRRHRTRGAALVAAPPDTAGLEHEYRRLSTLMRVDITCFERKQFENLSHASNKAMNLNAYIGLLGKTYHVAETFGSLPYLEECEPLVATLKVPSAEYVLTLDADSVILPDYALQLVRVLQSDPRIAVAQTPYSAFPGAPSTLERTAGATTDLQYIMHQGFTALRATYWVGANALLRVAALQDIRQLVEERGHIVPVFIQDRTVIEDTGSTIDLARRGWTLFNYPERLAYSATPPDFGSLIIQRRRWANGGLIILPDLLRLCLARRGERAGIAEALMRAYYLVSPAVSNLAWLVLLLYPFDVSLADGWMPLAGAAYYFIYGRDLVQNGYHWRDLPRVYALNLLLVPVNLAGVWGSLRQLWTGRKTPFGRTPKVEGRTATPPVYIACHAGMLLYVFAAGAAEVVQGRYAYAGLSLSTVGAYFYGLAVLIGWREAWNDLLAGFAERAPRLSNALQLAPALQRAKRSHGIVEAKTAQAQSRAQHDRARKMRVAGRGRRWG